MKFVEVSEKSIEKAIKKGLEELNASLEDVDVKVINEGGLFSKAKIKMTLIGSETEEDLKASAILEKIEERASVSNDKPKTLKYDTKKEVKVKKEKVEKIEKVAKVEKVESAPKSEFVRASRVYNNSVSHEDNVKNALTFVNGLMEVLNFEVEVKAEKQEENTIIKINGAQAGDLIGYRGEALAAVQFLVNNITEREEGSRILKKLVE